MKDEKGFGRIADHWAVMWLQRVHACRVEVVLTQIQGTYTASCIVIELKDGNYHNQDDTEIHHSNASS